MKLRNIRYFVSQGFKSVFTNGLMSFASVGIVTASILVFGIFVLVGLNVTYVGDQIKEQCELQVYIKQNVDRDGIRLIGTKLSEIGNVKEAALYTKEEAFTDLKEMFADKAEAIASLENDNPLRDSYRVTLKDISKAAETAGIAAAIENVSEVKNRQDLVKKVIDITDFFRIASLWLVLILGGIAVFIISNTIKLGMFARRREINIMKFIGATDGFIRWPFIIEGLFIGVVGAAIAAALMLWGYVYVFPHVNQFMEPLKLQAFNKVYNYVIISFATLGGGIGIVGSYISIRKHLHV